MAIRNLNNVASPVAQNQLSITPDNLNRTAGQPSSSSKINSGEDDSAGLAIADGLHANVTDFMRALGPLKTDSVEARILKLNHALTVTEHLQIGLDHECGAEAASLPTIGSL